MKVLGPKNIIHEGRYIRFVQHKNWEYVERTNCKGVVIIVAVTDDNKILFVEQYRPPVGKNVIELPAGLVNDEWEYRGESLLSAAKRELVEETGYKAKRMVKLVEGPVSGGLTSDMVTIVRALGLTKVAKGGGTGIERLVTHEVPLQTVRGWLKRKERQGCLIEPKIFAGLYFITNEKKI